MGILEDQHREHKARQLRIKTAAFKVPAPAPTPPPPVRGLGPTFDIVINEVCSYYNVLPMNILSNRRINKIITPRYMISYLIYRLTTFTNPQIAKKLNRDPTSIGYAIHKIESAIEEHIKDIEALEKLISAKMDLRREKLHAT